VVDVSVVIPVFNEEESVPSWWAELRGVLDTRDLGYEVVFVDDALHPHALADAGPPRARSPRQSPAPAVRPVGLMNRVVVTFVDLLAVRWMKSRVLCDEVTEDLGGDLPRE